jgi:hypothetical protein
MVTNIDVLGCLLGRLSADGSTRRNQLVDAMETSGLIR